MHTFPKIPLLWPEGTEMSCKQTPNSTRSVIRAHRLLLKSLIKLSTKTSACWKCCRLHAKEELNTGTEDFITCKNHAADKRKTHPAKDS